VHRVEFTIEPFLEGKPGPHVTAPVDEVRALGVEVEMGPFGSGCLVESDRVEQVVSTIVRAALDHGASHVNIDIDGIGEVDGP
jgi:uncharacterized protein YqgV (UPF0045/DUF77 family)